MLVSRASISPFSNVLIFEQGPLAHGASVLYAPAIPLGNGGT
jgi:hypothetical protein